LNSEKIEYKLSDFVIGYDRDDAKLMDKSKLLDGLLHNETLITESSDLKGDIQDVSSGLQTMTDWAT